MTKTAAPKKLQPGAPAAKRSRGRPKGATAPVGITGFRIPPAVLARLDALVDQRNAELAAQGASVNRTSLLVAAIMEFCDRHEREAATPRDAT